MDVTTIASILLTGRIVALGFMIWVLNRQIYLFRNYYAEGFASTVRKILFILAIILFFSNLTPAVIDGLAIVDVAQKSSSRGITTYGLIYTLSNMITSVASAVAMFGLYILAKRILEESTNRD